MDTEKCSYLNAKNQLLQNNLASELIRESKTLLKSAWQHFYPNFLLIQDNLSSKTCL